MTCRNTEKEVFTVAYPLSVPVNALDRRGHQMGARPETGRGTFAPRCHGMPLRRLRKDITKDFPCRFRA
jgi:hypothetical protein